jgi:hypothetical protein
MLYIIIYIVISLICFALYHSESGKRNLLASLFFGALGPIILLAIVIVVIFIKIENPYERW